MSMVIELHSVWLAVVVERAQENGDEFEEKNQWACINSDEDARVFIIHLSIVKCMYTTSRVEN